MPPTPRQPKGNPTLTAALKPLERLQEKHSGVVEASDFKDVDDRRKPRLFADESRFSGSPGMVPREIPLQVWTRLRPTNSGPLWMPRDMSVAS